MVSEPFGSLDTEFRNEVYEILARHESRFDILNNKINQIHDILNNKINQFHITLQTVLTELRALHVNRYGNTVDKELTHPSIPVETPYCPHITPTTHAHSHYITSTITHTSPTGTTIPNPKFDRHTRPKLPFPRLGGDFLTRWINNKKVELPADLFGIYLCGQG